MPAQVNFAALKIGARTGTAGIFFLTRQVDRRARSILYARNSEAPAPSIQPPDRGGLTWGIDDVALYLAL